jgi:hypothetical protein|tara:strand:- start:1100 stop:1534 length:435 start_codon:yes stop_codon:yes gene_type:complete
MPYKGKFTPRDPKKYMGNPTNIIYRSSWELRVMNYFDRNPNILQWASEEFSIPYISPIDGRRHRYYPDFMIKSREKDGRISTRVIEVKPKKQCQPPKKRSKITKAYLSEVKAWGINSAKWNAAKEFCADRKWDFVILTEQELGL